MSDELLLLLQKKVDILNSIYQREVRLLEKDAGSQEAADEAELNFIDAQIEYLREKNK
jgi:hypothetical protein